MEKNMATKLRNIFLFIILISVILSGKTNIVSASEGTTYTYTISVDGDYIRTQEAYLASTVYMQRQGLVQPSDLFIYGKEIFIADTGTKRLDQGSDYYGANFTGNDRIEESNHNLISLGWVGNWNYFTSGIHSDEEAKSDFLETIGFYATPRQLQLDKDGIIQSAPLYKNEQLTLKYQNSNISSQRPLIGDNRKPWIDKSHNQNSNGLLDLAGKNSSGYYQLHFSNIKKEGGYIYIDIWQGSDYVKIAYQITSGTYQVSAYAAELNNSMDGSQTASSYYYDGLLGNGQGYKVDSHYKETDNITITLITDNRSLEIFFPNGQTYTLARFNTSDKQDVKVFSTQKDLLLNLKIYDVHS